jgi:hypothetical protein
MNDILQMTKLARSDLPNQNLVPPAKIEAASAMLPKAVAAAEKDQRVRSEAGIWPLIKELADSYLAALGYPEPAPFISTGEDGQVPIYLEIKKANGAPLLWVLLAHSVDPGGDLLSGYFFDGVALSEEPPRILLLTELGNEERIWFCHCLAPPLVIRF